MRISDWSSDVCSSDLAEVKAIAAQWVIEQPTINPDTGEASTRKNLPSDPFPKPFANDVAARAANNNALPPDLSLMGEEGQYTARAFRRHEAARAEDRKRTLLNSSH